MCWTRSVRRLRASAAAAPPPTREGLATLQAAHIAAIPFEALDALTPSQPLDRLPLRLPVQAIYKFDDRRIVAGRIEAGRLEAGDDIVIMPAGKIAKIKTVEGWPVTPLSGPQGTGRPAIDGRKAETSSNQIAEIKQNTEVRFVRRRSGKREAGHHLQSGQETLQCRVIVESLSG